MSTRPIGSGASEHDPGVTRRQFVNRGLVATGGVLSGGMLSALVAFLWPAPASGFGAKVVAGRLSDIRDAMVRRREPYYVPAARAYLAPYPAEALAAAREVYDERLVPGLEAGVVALYQKCAHLGCKVPWCGSSQWFECPCHGSRYNRVGEQRGTPAPRGMDHFPIEFDDDRVVIDTSQVVPGMPVGTDTTGQQAEGPHCVKPGG